MTEESDGVFRQKPRPADDVRLSDNIRSPLLNDLTPRDEPEREVSYHRETQRAANAAIQKPWRDQDVKTKITSAEDDTILTNEMFERD